MSSLNASAPAGKTNRSFLRLGTQQLGLGAAFGGGGHPNQILLQQVNGCGEKGDILHEESNVSGHCRKPGSGIPSIRHEGNDGDRGHEREGRTDRGKYSQSFISERKEQERTE